MRVAVVGAGAIGCFYGGLLAKENNDVTFVARGKTRDALEKQGLTVKSIWGNFSIPVKVVDSEHLDAVDAFDVILLAIKSTALEDALPELQLISDESTRIACLLNGIGNEERLSDVFTEQQIIGGSAFASVIREAPGVVNHVGEGRLVLGEWAAAKPTFPLKWLISAFQQAGADVSLSDNIRQIKWEKLLWNMTYNPLTALTGTRVGEALDDPDLYHLLEKVSREYLALASAAGVTIGADYQRALLIPDDDVRRHKTSMLQDFENGREMELQAILGFAIRVANMHNVKVDTIETLHALLRFFQKKNR
ncbi:MAG: 2-dehydropantoate 2-reductase [Sporolactobacillus sp.]